MYWCTSKLFDNRKMLGGKNIVTIFLLTFLRSILFNSADLEGGEDGGVVTGHDVRGAAIRGVVDVCHWV